MGTRIPVSINGNLVADPELSYGESGIAHAKLRVAVTGDLEFRSYEKDGAQHEARRIVAEVIGPDLRFGTASYGRTPKANAGPSVEAQGPVHAESGVANGYGWVPTMPVAAPSMGGITSNGLRI